MNEALSILEELTEIMKTFDSGTDICETIPGTDDSPTLKRSISLYGITAFLSALQEAQRNNTEPNDNIIKLGQILLSQARWHEERTDRQDNI